MSENPFTDRLVKYMLLLLGSVGGFFLVYWLGSLLPQNVMRLTIWQWLISTGTGIVLVALLIFAVLLALALFAELLRAYEKGADILNERERPKRKRSD